MAESGQSTVPIEPPRGIRQASVDAKGRLKLPSVMQQYLTSLGERKVFITSFDYRTGRIYPLSAWRQIEQFFDEFQEAPEIAEHVSLIANDVGADSEMDNEGRLLLPQELRRRLKLDGPQQVYLHPYKGRINIYTAEVYAEMKARAEEGLPEKVRLLEQKGLK